MITGDDAAHIALSLRTRPGETLTVCDTAGTDYVCRVTAVSPERVTLEIESETPCESEPPVKITLFTCLLKGEAFDSAVRSAVELGAARIVPVLSSRCVSRPDGKAAAAKVARWRRIAAEAAGQSGRGIIPEVAPITPFGELPKLVPAFGKALFFYELGGASPLSFTYAPGETVAVITGCEGGFAKAEAEALIAAGASPVSLGPRILRAETAPAAALAVVTVSAGGHDGGVGAR